MIISYGCKDTEELFKTEKNRRFSSLTRIALRKLIQMNQAIILDDLSRPPGNNLEILKGRAEGWYSIRINNQWRIVFRWTKAGPEKVEIKDYHS